MPETTSRPPRVSAYQARIERTLTDVFLNVPTHNQATQEWRLVNVAHTTGYAQCELCGHFPIKRLFFIESASTHTVKMIGSECARNYVSVDLVQAYERSLNRIANQRRTERRRAEQRAERQRAFEARQAARLQESATWAAEHATEVAWLQANHAGDTFLTSLATSLEAYGRLTDRQLECVRNNMQRATTPRPTNAADRAATPDQVPHIYNGTYTMDNGSRHLTFRIHTATRGPLQGKRIVKRQLQYGEFQGFAFVGSDGSLIVWRRFQEQAGETYQVWAAELLRCLNARTNEAPGLDTITHATTEHGTFTIQRTRTCRRCNRMLTVPTSIESGIGPECSRRDASENRTSVADAHAPAATQAAPAARPVPHRLHLDERSRRAPVAAEQAPGQLAMSELGTGMVQ